MVNLADDLNTKTKKIGRYHIKVKTKMIQYLNITVLFIYFNFHILLTFSLFAQISLRAPLGLGVSLSRYIF